MLIVQIEPHKLASKVEYELCAPETSENDRVGLRKNASTKSNYRNS